MHTFWKLALAIFMIMSLSLPTAFARDLLYHEKNDYLLIKGDNLYIDDLKVKVRDVDHLAKTATLSFSVGNHRVEQVKLRKGDYYTFQNKLTVQVLDAYRKQTGDHGRTYYARIALQPKQSGIISEFNVKPLLGQRPYIIIQNTGLSTETFFLKFATNQKTYSIKAEKQFVTLDPFESRKIFLKINQQASYRHDTVEADLIKDGIIIEMSKITI